MVDWNPFSDEAWDEAEPLGFGGKPSKKPEPASPQKGDAAPARGRPAFVDAPKIPPVAKPAAPPQEEPALRGFSRGRPAFVDIPDAFKAAPPSPSSAPAKGQEPPPPPPKGVKRILIIDDNLMVRRNHKLFLERLGFEVLEAVEGKNGLDKMAHYAPETFSLVIVDLNMPVMSGEEFVAEAKVRFGEKMPPVWVCTVSSDAETVRSLLAHGIAGYLLKPVQFRAFATKLQALFPDLELRIP